MQVQAYLNFDGRCEEALEFYGKALDAEVLMLMRFRENPEPSPDMPLTPELAEKVMHTSFKVGESVVMASDMFAAGSPKFEGITLTLALGTVAEAEKRFAALAEGGQVMQPLQRTFFSPAFGMLTDKFGVSWMVLTSAE